MIEDAFQRLAVVSEPCRDKDTLIASVLDVVSDSLGADAAVLLQVEGRSLRVVAVCARAGTNPQRDDTFALSDTHYAHLLEGAIPSLVVKDARSDGLFSSPAATRALTIGTYTGAPVRYSGGQIYGALCVLYARPHRVRAGETALLKLAGCLAVQAVETAALEESERLFRATFEQATVGIAHVGLDGACLIVNQKLCAITGNTGAELLGRRFQGMSTSSEAASARPYRRRLLDVDRSYIKRLLSGRLQSYTLEKQYVRKDETLTWVNIAVSLVRAPNGAPRYFIWVIEDITERKQAEVALRDARTSERQRIARDLHDDVLQDLVSIQQNLQVIRAKTQDPASRDELEQESKALQQMVQRLRSAIYDLRPQEQSLVRTIELLAGLTRPMSPHQEVELVIEKGFSPAFSAWEVVEITRIVQEALVNAKRHASASCITVTAGADAGEVWVEVADNGRGFETMMEVGGLGLRAMQERAHGLGGTLTVESGLGQGTRVRVKVFLNARQEVTTTSSGSPTA